MYLSTFHHPLFTTFIPSLPFFRSLLIPAPLPRMQLQKFFKSPFVPTLINHALFDPRAFNLIITTLWSIRLERSFFSFFSRGERDIDNRWRAGLLSRGAFSTAPKVNVPVFVGSVESVYIRYGNLVRVNLFRRLLPRYRVVNEGQAGLNVIHTRGLNLKR